MFMSRSSHYNLVRYGAIAAVVSGILIILGALLSALHPSQVGPSLGQLKLDFLEPLSVTTFSILVGVIYPILAAAALLGLFILLTLVGRCDKLAIVGVILACLSLLTLSGSALYQLGTFIYYNQLIETTTLSSIDAVAALTSPLGILILGFAAYRAPELLGRWRVLPIVLAFVVSPGSLVITEMGSMVGGWFVDDANRFSSVSFVIWVPIVAGLLWITLGSVILSIVEDRLSKSSLLMLPDK